jgi:7-carboxy-7-deazaguanine synthase
MRIAEIFYSIQGEGLLTGVPSVFIRTSGCNLRCRWCDTPYASWRPEGESLSEDEILARLAAFPTARHVVLTGGEPMLAPGIHSLAARLRSAGWHITIETAGTLPPADIACDLASLSPKLSGSTPRPSDSADPAWTLRHEATRLQPAILNQWLQYPFQLKFVVGSPTELQEIDALLQTLTPPVPPHLVLLMPEGTETTPLRTQSLSLVELCKTRGFRFCDRLHVHLFGNTRGT